MPRGCGEEMQQKLCHRKQISTWPLKMKLHPPPVLLIFIIYCICTVRFISGLPQPFESYLDETAMPKNERLALCFSQWTELSNQPQISSSVMDLCKSMLNSMQSDEEHNQEYKRFLFHYSRAQQDSTCPLKSGSLPLHPLMRLAPKLSDRRMKRFLDSASQITAAELTRKDALGRPFFLFRPRNGRTVNVRGE